MQTIPQILIPRKDTKKKIFYDNMNTFLSLVYKKTKPSDVTFATSLGVTFLYTKEKSVRRTKYECEK